jgi:hypothetical protein
VWGPPVGPSCVHETRSVGRVPRSAQHAGVGGIERRATVDECGDVVERQVTRWMRRMLGTIARADVAVLADVAGDHPLGQACPSCIRMDVMVGTDARQASVLGTAAPRAAGDDTTDRAQLHPRIVDGLAGAVHSPGVLRLRGEAIAFTAGTTTTPHPIVMDRLLPGTCIPRTTIDRRTRVLARRSP